MKEQVLGASDRAALQGLIPLAGALGAGTIFALFFANRRRNTGFAMFEVFTIVAVLTSVGTTAYFCISLLHQNEAISDGDLTKTATPLIVAVFLLVFISVFARLPGSVGRLLTLFPLAIGAGVVALELSSSAWSTKPEYALLVAAGILAVGALLGALGAAFERRELDWHRDAELRHIENLLGGGYVPETLPLRYRLPLVKADLALIERDAGTRSISCWRRQERVYLEIETCLRLRDLVAEHWRALGAGEAEPPPGPEILARVELSRWIPKLRRQRRLTISTFDRAAGKRTAEILQDDRNLFDVTELGLVEPGAPAPA